MPLLIAALAATYVLTSIAVGPPVFHGSSLDGWLHQAVDTDPVERLTAVRALTGILASIVDRGPTSCGPFGLMGLSSIQQRRQMDADRKVVRQHLAEIAAVLKLASRDQDPKIRRDVMFGFGYYGDWSNGKATQLVLPDLIAGCSDEDQRVAQAARSSLTRSLKYTASLRHPDLPLDELMPILISALEEPDLQFNTILILGTLGPAAREALPSLKKLSSGGKSQAPRQLIWAIDRIRGLD